MKVKKAPDCPYCGVKMLKIEPPPFSYSDGPGWGVPYVYMCFNDDCKLFAGGWKNLEENFQQHASYRCVCFPDGGNFESFVVYSRDGYRGQIIENDEEEEQL